MFKSCGNFTIKNNKQVIDLKKDYIIHHIIIKTIYNYDFDDSKNVILKFSIDNKNWDIIPNYLYSYCDDGYSLYINLANNFKARYIEIYFDQTQITSLKSIEVFKDIRVESIIDLLRNNQNQITLLTSSNVKLNINSLKHDNDILNQNSFTFNNQNDLKSNISFKNNVNIIFSTNGDCVVKIKLNPIQINNFNTISDFYSIKIDEEEKITKLTPISHEKPFELQISVIKNTPISINVKARAHSYSIEELLFLKKHLDINTIAIYEIMKKISNKKRLAICFFGHLRTYVQTYQSFNKYILEPSKKNGYNVDIFIHTWDKLNSDSNSWHQGRGYLKELNNISVNENVIVQLEKFYNPISIQIDCLPEGIHGQTMSRKKLVEMVKSYSIKNNFIYDCILFTRTDLMFKNELNIDKYFNLYKNNLKIVLDDNCIFTASNIFKRMPVADPRYVNEGDLIFFHSCHTINEYFETPINFDKNIQLIPIDYKLYHDFDIWRELQ
ncbi:hypothetical protein AVBRAN12640_09525 [Campylobacter sp. RM12640]|uniref:hypothetical protein n=1 Tax=unclassified Campylobacter TaxID=2593542 RepID=UPI0030151FBA|nr:hypothetical protein [Campylobacter sp. RM12640]MBZ7990026.1 hypothetical protein [Campylobacter sp. RM12635]